MLVYLLLLNTAIYHFFSKLDFLTVVEHWVVLKRGSAHPNF